MTTDIHKTKLTQVLDQQSNRALLLIDMETGEIHGTQRWRELNEVEPDQTLSRTLLNQTIPQSSRDAFVSYSKAFFQSPLETPPVTLELNLCGLKGHTFRGLITSYKVEIDGRVLACTEVVEI